MATHTKSLESSSTCSSTCSRALEYSEFSWVRVSYRQHLVCSRTFPEPCDQSAQMLVVGCHMLTSPMCFILYFPCAHSRKLSLSSQNSHFLLFCFSACWGIMKRSLHFATFSHEKGIPPPNVNFTIVYFKKVFPPLNFFVI